MQHFRGLYHDNSFTSAANLPPTASKSAMLFAYSRAQDILNRAQCLRLCRRVAVLLIVRLLNNVNRVENVGYEHLYCVRMRRGNIKLKLETF